MNIIEPAKSSRSSCRGCKEKIEKGELRYGNYDEMWDSHKWYHLKCGAAFNLTGFKQAAADYGEIENLEQLLEEAKEASRGTGFPRAEPAPSARAACMHCDEKIAPKGTLRVVVEREVEGFGKKPGYLHPKCAPEFVGEDKEALLATLLEMSKLDEEQIKALNDEMA
mgnify:CR=1 FL=1